MAIQLSAGTFHPVRVLVRRVRLAFNQMVGLPRHAGSIIAEEQRLRTLDADVLAAADFQAERITAFVRLAVSVCLTVFLGALVFAVGRANNWLIAVCLMNLSLAMLGIHVTRRGIFRSWFPWLISTGDALFLFGVGWFGPWLSVLPSGSAFALVSQWAVFLILSIEALRAQAKTILFQTLLMCGLLSLLVWKPVGGPSEVSVYGFEQLFSDSSNITRIAIIMLSGLVLAIGAGRSRVALKRAIAATRERANLQRFHPAELKNQIAAGNIEALKQGRRHKVSVVFADLRSFTALSQDLPPERVVKLLNSFRARSERVIRRHGGVIDKFIGDGFLAVFGLMEPGRDDSKKAVDAAQSLVSEIENWSAKRSAEGRKPLTIGVGIHSGEAFAGIVGTDRVEFTVIGDAVNVAQRLEALTKETGCAIMASETVLVDAGVELQTKGLWNGFPDVSLRGRAGNITAYGSR